MGQRNFAKNASLNPLETIYLKFRENLDRYTENNAALNREELTKKLFKLDESYLAISRYLLARKNALQFFLYPGKTFQTSCLSKLIKPSTRLCS